MGRPKKSEPTGMIRAPLSVKKILEKGAADAKLPVTDYLKTIFPKEAT